ncbi:EamA family transporter [Streptomyces sp. NBC_01260]|uniref:EamA family transporter n=1 Tax=unclassified Streptomyces TaxID=2593676 RepID=UPI0022552E37|nr:MULTISPECIES: EamA family transporter [unclassified Streptomyces]MCX4770829.1 EamA family transporter [Streptomyces sp. NBC_01285]
MPAVLVLLLSGTWLLSGSLVTGTDPLIVAVGRSAVCCLVLTVVAASSTGGRADLRRAAARPGTVWLLGLLGFAGYAAGTLLAIPRIGTSLTNLVVALMPCASVAVGALFFGERSGPRKAAGAVLACAAAAGYAALGADAGDLDAVGLLLLVAAATVAFAVYGFLYRDRLSGLPPLAVLPVLLAAATCLLLPMALPALIAHPPTLAATGGIVVLGAVVYAPAYLVQHRLILLRGPVFTAAVQLAVPFTVRLGDWALDSAPAPSLAELLLLAVCCAGIALVTVQASRSVEPAPSDR